MLVILLTGIAPRFAYADCAAEFKGGVEPAFISSKAPAKLHDICFTEYDMMYSGGALTATWSAVHYPMSR